MINFLIQNVELKIYNWIISCNFKYFLSKVVMVII